MILRRIIYLAVEYAMNKLKKERNTAVIVSSLRVHERLQMMDGLKYGRSGRRKCTNMPMSRRDRHWHCADNAMNQKNSKEQKAYTTLVVVGPERSIFGNPLDGPSFPNSSIQPSFPLQLRSPATLSSHHSDIFPFQAMISPHQAVRCSARLFSN